MIDAITLQRVDQNQIDFHICTKHDHQNKSDEKNKDKSCVCDWIHLFKECVYLVSVNRKSKWKKNIKIRNEIRQKLQKNSRLMNTIKRLIDINILNDLINSFKKKKNEKDKNHSNDNTSSNDNDLDYSFAESAFAISKLMKSSHSLLRSVIYDSKCSQSLIFNKNRFINEIISSNNLIKI
jgi:hypothetical protein